MPKILAKSKNKLFDALIRKNKKPGYILEMDKPVEDFSSICAMDQDVHCVIVDHDLITPEQVRQIKIAAGDELFPIVFICESLTEKEVNKWLRLGVSEFIRLDQPESIINRRIGSAVQIYCMSRSLYGQATDTLTGLYNLEAFYHFAKEMINQDPSADYLIILSDIEQFKLINERFGEEKGDELLRYVGKELGKLNGEHILFARYSGDQFVGIIRKPPENIPANDNLLFESMKQLYAGAPVERFRVQFGMYDMVDKSLPISIMCDRALMALRTIKHQYDQTICLYTPQLQQKFNREQQILESMEQALAQGQFQVYYQPKHNICTSEVVSTEALVRWIHPDYGFLSPSEFIPLFERNGFISRLDKYVWNRVCLDMKKQIEQGIPVVPVSVNASRKDIVRDNFLDVVLEPIEKLGLDPGLFHMEVTETIYMEDPEILAPLISQLQAKGIKIELDDFGSGFSSLGILSKLPVDIVKLDISLIRNMEKQPVIVESIIQLMHTMGYQVIAEGTETYEQLETLKKMGCDAAQGYYYSKPLPLTGLETYLLEYNS